MDMILPVLTFLMSFGHFVGAVDFDMDVENNVYVVDRAANTIVKYSPKGDSMAAVSGFGSQPGQFDGPVAVCASRGNDVYVADYNNHRVQRFTRNLDYVTAIVTRDDPDERKRFGYPRDIAVTRQGDLLVLDGENRRVVKFNAAGEAAFAFGDFASGKGQLIDPMRIEVDEFDNVYVLDRSADFDDRNRVVRYDPFGNYQSVPFQYDEGLMGAIATRNGLMAISGSVPDALTLMETPELRFGGAFRIDADSAVTMLWAGDRALCLQRDRLSVYTIADTTRR